MTSGSENLFFFTLKQGVGSREVAGKSNKCVSRVSDSSDQELYVDKKGPSSLVLKCAGAGNLRDEILYYRKELLNCSSDDDETRSYIMDKGIKALRSVHIT
ncbi:hypothetical protein IEQ34_005807 [Dendrobium chrysotoxum]|uniref:Uncharacterized protein n=1 Tax=Dendrobium chrysotoxum TaxID=161865 RepID=A0AAV7GW29_DENCH|nr:hypothetical protein IEQ34_005807 [Dendrobium chrysotoxum]